MDIKSAFSSMLPNSGEPTKAEKRFEKFRFLRDREKTWTDKTADWLTESFGTVPFFAFHIVFFFGWIILNAGIIPGLTPFDPFPYGLLTMVVSLEAIFLSVIVLMSQNRAGKVADLREELDLKVNIWAEKEITKILNMVDEIHDHLGLAPEDDRELKKMKKQTDIYKL